MRKPTFWFPTWSDTNQAVQLQKMARGLQFWIKKVKGLDCVCSENKGADQLRGYVFLFSHMPNVGFLNAAHLFLIYQGHIFIKIVA